MRDKTGGTGNGGVINWHSGLGTSKNPCLCFNAFSGNAPSFLTQPSSSWQVSSHDGCDTKQYPHLWSLHAHKKRYTNSICKGRLILRCDKRGRKTAKAGACMCDCACHMHTIVQQTCQRSALCICSSDQLSDLDITKWGKGGVNKLKQSQEQLAAQTRDYTTVAV